MFVVHWRGLAALAYKIKTYKNLFCGGFGQIFENLHQRKFPAIQKSRSGDSVVKMSEMANVFAGI